MDAIPLVLDPARIFGVAADLSCPARLFLPDATEAFTTVITAIDHEGIQLQPVRPAHGNLVLDRIRAGLRIELTVSGLPIVATVNLLDISETSLRIAIPDRVARVQRRRYYRVAMPEGTEVAIQIGDEVRSRALIDVSTTGAAFRAHAIDADLVPGTSIELVQFTMSAGRSLIAAAKVMQRATRGPTWATERIVGLEFEAVAPRDRDRLAAFISERERQLLRERSRQPDRPVDDVLLVVRGPGNRTRLRNATSLGSRTVAIERQDDDDDLAVGLVLDDVEIRLAGSTLVRSPMKVELAGDTSVTLGIPELPAAQRSRFLLSLRALE